MRCKRRLSPAAAIPLLGSFLLAGCGLMTPDEGPTVEYRDAESTKKLEVPPDLTRPESSGALSVDGSGQGGSRVASTGSSATATGGGGSTAVLPEFDGVRFVRAGASSWLEVSGVPPDAVWPRIERFLRSEGLSIARSKPNLGIIETGWASRYDGPESGGLTGFFDRALGGLGEENIRDRYNIRLERMDGGGTRIFVAHQAAQEIDTEANTRNLANFEWVRRGGDPSVEAEMARRLLVYLGVSEQRSGTIVANAADPTEGRVRYLVSDGRARLAVGDANPRRVFARVGDALGRIGAEVRSADDARGVYAIEWKPPKDPDAGGGFFGWFGDDEPRTRRLELQIYRQQEAVRIRAADEGGTPRSGEVHRALLRELAVAMGADKALVRGAEETDAADEDDADYQAPDGPQM